MRGKAGSFPLNRGTIKTVGSSLARRLKEKLGRPPLVVIGRDTRESGRWLEQALIFGLSKEGAEYKSAGVITTPGVAYLARTVPADAGVVISASHNAYSDNGIKIFAPSGRKLDEETERLIETDVFLQPQGAATDNTVPLLTEVETDQGDASDLKSQYIAFLADKIGRNLSLSGLTLVLDCANGAASKLAPELFERLGAAVKTINNEPDGRNINLKCGSLHPEALQARVVAERADLGVAFDGDADRALFVDAKGSLVNGDGSLWVLAKYLNSHNELTNKMVVATVMSNVGLEIALQSEAISLVRTDVGDKYVLEELMRLGGSLGGEQSGHIIFPRVSLAGDGLITTLNMLRAMTEAGKSLHQLTEGFQAFPQILMNIEVRVKRPFSEVAAIRQVMRDVERELGSEGRLLLRYSGTEPLARVMIEGKSHKKIERLAESLGDVIQQTLAK